MSGDVKKITLAISLEVRPVAQITTAFLPPTQERFCLVETRAHRPTLRVLLVREYLLPNTLLI